MKKLSSKAKKLRKTDGFASCPEKRKGRPLSEVTVKKVKDFYLVDESSRMLPSVQDCVSVKVKFFLVDKIIINKKLYFYFFFFFFFQKGNGKQIRIQKRLLLFNIRDLYIQFQEKYPEFKISMSKFSKLRPRQCILAGKGGTHNVCVCSIHQNSKLKIFGIKKALQNAGVSYDERDKNMLRKWFARSLLLLVFSQIVRIDFNFSIIVI